MGEKITGSTGNPTTNWYGNTALYIYNPPQTTDLENLRFRYAYTTLQYSQSTGPTNQVHVLRNVQIYNHGWGISVINTGLQIENALFDLDQATVGGQWRPAFIASQGGVINCFNATIHSPDQLFYKADGNANNQLNLTNSLMIAPNLSVFSGYSGGYNGIAQDGAGIFQTLAAGAHYLVTNSIYRGVGTTAISPALANILAKSTTYPPATLGSNINSATILAPTVVRNTGLPDLGYHYPALDYIGSQVAVTAPVNLTNGVAIGFSGISGFVPGTNGSVTSFGLPNQLNVLTLVNSVQEKSAGGVTNTTGFILLNGPGQTLRFTDVSFMASGTGGRTIYPGNMSGTATFQDSIVRGVYWSYYSYSGGGNGGTINLLDTTLERCAISWTQGYVTPYYLTTTIQNCLLSFSTLGLVHADPYYGTWTMYDNLFDNTTTTITEFGTGINTNVFTSWGYNGFINCSNPLSGTGNKTGLARDFIVGPIGNYYYPVSGATNSLATLIDADSSRTPASVGLWHFTTVIDQRKETNSALDIGRHYVATEAYQASKGFSGTQGSNGWWYLSAYPAMGLPNSYLPNYGTNSAGWAGTPVWYNSTFTYSDIYCAVLSGSQHPGVNYDSVRSFVAPHGGAVTIQGGVSSGQSCSGADGTLIRILKNSYSMLGWQAIPQGTTNLAANASGRVQTGDALYFQVNAGTNASNYCDWTLWDPLVTFDTAMDTDGDGIFDYIEDFNGNGNVDSGETDWRSATDLGLQVWITEPKPNANVP